jgi:tRNA G18 (ribose-2'-O)-methylase SpoU
MQRAYSDRQAQAVLLAAGVLKDKKQKLLDPAQARVQLDAALGLEPVHRANESVETREWREAMGLR